MVGVIVSSQIQYREFIVDIPIEHRVEYKKISRGEDMDGLLFDDFVFYGDYWRILDREEVLAKSKYCTGDGIRTLVMIKEIRCSKWP